MVAMCSIQTAAVMGSKTGTKYTSLNWKEGHPVKVHVRDWIIHLVSRMLTLYDTHCDSYTTASTAYL